MRARGRDVLMSDLFSFETCDGCGGEFPASEVHSHGSKRLCKKCYKIANPPKPRVKRDEQKDGILYKEEIPLDTASIAGRGRPVAIEVSSESIASIAGAMASSLASVLSAPIKIELAPVKVQLAGMDEMDEKAKMVVPPAAMQDTRASNAKATSIPATPHALGNVDDIVLAVMGASTRRQKWRPAELHAEIGILHPDKRVTVDDVSASLERLSSFIEDTPPAKQVIKLSTRFIRGDAFEVIDQLEYLDIVILKVLEHGGARGLPATIVHECTRLLNLEEASQPTVLNHLRVLRSPGWDVLEKSGSGLRDNYTITSKGSGIIGDSVDAFLGFDYSGDWKARFIRWGVITGDGKPGKRASLFTDPIREIVVKHAPVTDKQLMVALIDGSLDGQSLELHARTVAALEYLGITVAKK